MQIPVILSACLVSIEAEPHLRLFLSTQQGGDAMSSLTSSSSNSNTFTSSSSTSKSSKPKLPTSSSSAINPPEDTSLTLIMTFPTSSIISFDQEQTNQQFNKDDESAVEDFFNTDTHHVDEDMEGVIDLFNTDGAFDSIDGFNLNTKLDSGTCIAIV